MKVVALLAVILALAACIPAAGSIHGARVADPIAVARSILDDERSSYVMVVAHRACWADGAPENSLAAIRQCIALHADMIEIDVALTADGVPVLMHDPSVDRMTDGAGEVSTLSFAGVRSLRLRAGAGGRSAALTDERVPTLREALEVAKGKILINLDVKGDLFSQAFAVVRSVGVENQILMKMSAAPDAPELRHAAFLGHTLFMPIIRECTTENAADACTSSLSRYAPAFSRFDPVAFEIVFSNPSFLAEGARELTALGGRVWVNTLNPTLAGGIVDADALADPAATWGRVLSLGANIIQTDHPRELIAYLQKVGRRGGPPSL